MLTGSSAGFSLPYGNLRGPDVSFVSSDRLRQRQTSAIFVAPL